MRARFEPGDVPLRPRRLRRAARGFTLLELTLVALIVGVVSALAVPRLSRAGRNADVAAQHEDWSRVQRQIEFYATEHGGAYPASVGDGVNAAGTAAAFRNQMTRFTAADGRASQSLAAPYIYGPYLRGGLPPLKLGPHAGRSGVYVISGTAVPSYQAGRAVGWVYNATTGEILPNIPTDRAELDLPVVGIDVKYGGEEIGALRETGGAGAIDLGAESP
jgi:general secretion pathway protein G